MKPLNYFLIILSITAILFSCKKKSSEEIKLSETEPHETNSDVPVFRPVKVYVGKDSTNLELYSKYEYDNVGRVKTLYVYLDSTYDAFDEISGYKIDYYYSDKVVSKKWHAFELFSKKYMFCGWDSTFLDNNKRTVKGKTFFLFQSSIIRGIDTLGAKTNFQNAYTQIGDTLMKYTIGENYSGPYETNDYFDRNNVLIKSVNKDMNEIIKYTVADQGYFIEDIINGNTGVNSNCLFSFYEKQAFLKDGNSSFQTKYNYKWSFNSGKPINMSLTKDINGTISKSFYKYEY